VREEVVIELEGVGGHFQDHGVFWGEEPDHPLLEVGEAHANRTEEGVAVRIDTVGNELVLVNVKANETGRIR
jgi:hypothetical protein